MEASAGLQNFGLLIARLGTGGILLLHGDHALAGAKGVAACGTATSRSGRRTRRSRAWATIIFELVGGVFLIVGALTRFVGWGSSCCRC